MINSKYSIASLTALAVVLGCAFTVSSSQPANALDVLCTPSQSSWPEKAFCDHGDGEGIGGGDGGSQPESGPTEEGQESGEGGPE